MRAGEAARAMATCAASQIDRHAGVHYVSVAVVIVFSRAPSIPSLLRGSVARPVGRSVHWVHHRTLRPPFRRPPLQKVCGGGRERRRRLVPDFGARCAALRGTVL